LRREWIIDNNEVKLVILIDMLCGTKAGIGSRLFLELRYDLYIAPMGRYKRFLGKSQPDTAVAYKTIALLQTFRITY
jgi:hypothetical protein